MENWTLMVGCRVACSGTSSDPAISPRTPASARARSIADFAKSLAAEKLCTRRSRHQDEAFAHSWIALLEFVQLYRELRDLAATTPNSIAAQDRGTENDAEASAEPETCRRCRSSASPSTCWS